MGSAAGRLRVVPEPSRPERKAAAQCAEHERVHPTDACAGCGTLSEQRRGLNALCVPETQPRRPVSQAQRKARGARVPCRLDSAAEPAAVRRIFVHADVGDSARAAHGVHSASTPRLRERACHGPRAHTPPGASSAHSGTLALNGAGADFEWGGLHTASRTGTPSHAFAGRSCARGVASGPSPRASFCLAHGRASCELRRHAQTISAPEEVKELGARRTLIHSLRLGQFPQVVLVEGAGRVGEGARRREEAGEGGRRTGCGHCRGCADGGFVRLSVVVAAEGKPP
ncbi:hypothetical protein FB451DRAFT_1369453 [Mycena latifolia]|nr:hypothetical protein FB451DRAFT_1369453 [Mycena latifolia]